MDSAKRQGGKFLAYDEGRDEEESVPGMPVVAKGIWPMPCMERGDQAASINLYLTLHCPRCGQLANLDESFNEQHCLLKYFATGQLMLSGNHHEFEQ